MAATVQQKKGQQLRQVHIGRNPFCPQESNHQSRLGDSASKTMKLKSFVVTIALLLQISMVGGQTFCNRSLMSEWNTQPTLHTVKWSLSQDICSSFFTECWNIDSYHGSSTADNVPLRLSQICPLQLQLGDVLFVSSEPSFQSYGMNLANVSLEEFIRCPQPRDVHQHQLLFDHGLNGMHQIVPKWLGVGTHYFAEVPIRGPLLCHFGLRLNVTVKPHACQKFSNSTFCSGHGKCLSHIWDGAYHCHCSHPYSGQFCQEIDKCSSKPCHNSGICISRKSQREDAEDSYECICPPSFTGRNCSEIIGQCQQHCCGNGSCSNTSPNTFRCRCDKTATGPFCEETMKPCSSQPCQNEAVCYNNPSGYSCACPPGFLGPNCETDINECFSGPCQNGGICHDRPNDASCTCLPMFTGKFCEKSVTLCEPSPCLNNGSCIDEVESYHCRNWWTALEKNIQSCMPSYTGRNCEEVIDYCRLLSISCLNEGLCLNIIGGFSCLCAPGWTGQFCQFVENPCLIYPANCHPGATCIDISQSKLQPQTKCLCLPGFTGTFCEMEINKCDSNPCKNGGSCRDNVGLYKCICPLGFQGQQCKVNIDPCLFHNITCNSGAQCVDKPYDLAYICRTACKENSEPCVNGRCFHDEDNQNYLCVCAPGWTRPTCLENINNCEMSWCQNGTICEDGINEYRCLCPAGYSGAFCELGLDMCLHHCCSDHGFCVANQNNYTCHCVLGYEGPLCEVEANECSNSPCKNGATCLDLIGHFLCHCATGFKGETCNRTAELCADGPCRNGGTCEETVNGFKCSCLSGFEGLNCEINFDDCSRSFCKNNSTCLDLVEDYTCVCPPGFTDKNCSMDIDECAFKPCKNGASCHNLIGKFYCNCLPGFLGELCESKEDSCLSQPCGTTSLCQEDLDGYSCFCAPGFIGVNCDIEVNECLSGPCHNGATCINQLNAFNCLCSSGFEGTLCEINTNECHSNPCIHNGTCMDLINGYSCICLSGFAGIHCESDLDECASFPCKNGGTCIDQPGNYSCQCVAPFKGSNCEFKPCEGGNPCENGAACLQELDLTAFPLGFQCQCIKGFAGPRCEININECSSNPCMHGYCYDVIDGFYCFCNPGYAGQICDQDIDDCIINECKHNSTCMDLHLGYQCICQPGWEGPFCESESNECNCGLCKNSGTCIDLFNDFRCVCTAGWTGQQCNEDINECESAPCLNGATCYESIVPGQFFCACPPFYIGKKCQYHHNPCDAPYNPCRNNATCLAQVDGKPLCICQKGFEGTYCEIDNNECISNPCKNQGHCVDGVNSYRCFCRDGFFGILCEGEINECLSSPCANGGTCIDLTNRFLCNCPVGFYGAFCEVDINECETVPCLHGGSCFNKPGGYQCICDSGFTGKQCEVDIDECASAPCLNNGTCVDHINYYNCHCQRGFTGIKCETNTDECSSTPCLHGRCIDLIDGYRCSCVPGWTSSRCELNVNECESSPCLNGGSCQDLVNAFECICLSGYRGEFCEVDIDICTELLLNSSLCFNGGKCIDGPGRTFYCRCLNGFSGQFCEIDLNECSSSPCLHGSVCEDLINGYFCRCQKGWEGFRCEEDINECASHPCVHGICIQREPGLGYTCYCTSGYVGEHCELNYNDCLMKTCPAGFFCVDGINSVSCLPEAPNKVHSNSSMEGVSPTQPLERGLSQAQPSYLSGDVSGPQRFTDFSYIQYQGNSYMEFRGITLRQHNSINLQFQTFGFHGLLLYIEQKPTTMGNFVIQLSIQRGILEYQFKCDSGDEIKKISTDIRVDDGQKYEVHIRQDLETREAVVTIPGITMKRSRIGNPWSSLIGQPTGPIFIGGLPHHYAIKQVAGSIYNFTGCIEVTEINNLGPYTFPNAVDKNNIDSCRFPASEKNAATLLGPGPDSLKAVLTSTALPALFSVCQEDLCCNGGSCHQINLPDGVTSFRCDCALHFTGRFCEKDTTLFFPSFSGNSYLELPSLSSLLEDRFASGQERNKVTIYLTVKTTALNGTLLYANDEFSEEHFLHLYLMNGKPTARFGCGPSPNILTVTANHSINRDVLVPITLSYMLSLGSPEGYCLIEMAADEIPSVHQRTSLPAQMTQLIFGPIFLGNVPSHRINIHPNSGKIYGFRGCIRELQVNTQELSIIEEALEGQNIDNCNIPVCDYHPCRNGGTCTSDTENWFCECPPSYSGKLCQLSNCEQNPCGNGATCFPKSKQDVVCLCPYGRTGILCNDAINITSPSFSGTDAFGYTSFLAYSAIPNISLCYEFHLKFQLANHNSSLQDNLLFFTGQKGQGLTGDDFLVLGLRNGSLVYSYNLGSGIATITSEPLDLTLLIHTVSLGRFLRSGWMKVDNQKNKTITSPGKLTGLNVFSQFYVGGYIEYIPEFLPKGSSFKNGFQGCIFDLQVRAGKDQEFKAPGIPEGHPNTGRNVGQCEVSPCQLITCRNGGTCMESGSAVYCRCSSGWTGAFCTEKMSMCDPEHKSPHQCKQGSTCVSVPDGYNCHCALGTTGTYCEQALTISDASFSNRKSSWMSFEPFNIRHKVHIWMQFQTFSGNGILFYTAQHLSSRSGDFLSITMASGYIQLRYNLGDRTVVLQTFQPVHSTNKTWLLIKAGRVGNEGYLDLDGINVTQKATNGMTSLDTQTDFYVGGLPFLNLVNPRAIKNEPTGFTGCIREIFVNGKELKLNEKGAKGGSNIGDCDGTPCGYRVCKNNGKCKVVESDFSCLCPKQWIGKTCERSIYCSHSKCLHGSVCIPNPVLFSYTCACKLGWTGLWCEKQLSFLIAKFTGNSYIKYIDPNYEERDLRFTRVSFNFTTGQMDGLLLWLGKAEDEDNDFLGVGLENGMLKVVVNLGERIAVPLIHQRKMLCCRKWYFVDIVQNWTLIEVYLDEELVLFEDLDPQRKYTVLNYGGICYFGGFGLDRRVSAVTSGLFKQELIGKIKDVALFQDSKKINLTKAQGYNIYSGDKD
ncbi:protein eyes shut homolog [Pantherophis guttatus]|uniref:Protein eyes shut homolog n=1 Tax=Pantherophis guttatus TaxID=94885 RepID=A0A6P9DC29_PANGU|nr:protein eyes shut homolog [Pantherophis guttatus]